MSEIKNLKLRNRIVTVNGVFRKLLQPSVSPAAPHHGYSISEDQRDGDIQALLGFAENL